MPTGIYLPSQLNDLAVDVAVGSPAQGAIFYRGASKWNALAAGSAGQALVSGGPAANPSWADAAVGSVVLAPASLNRNLIQPTGDFKALILKATVGQTQSQIEFQDVNGVIIANIRPDGTFQFGTTAVPIDTSFFLTGSSVITAGNTSAFALRSLMTPNPAGNSASLFYGFKAGIASPVNALNFTDTLAAMRGDADHNGTGTVTSLVGTQGVCNKNSTGQITIAVGGLYQINNNNATGVITTGEGFRILNPTLTGGITTCRGIRIQNQGGTGVTTAQGLLIDGQVGAVTNNIAIQTGVGNVNLGDAVTITGSSDRIQLVVQGFSTQTNSILRVRNSAAAFLFDVDGVGSIFESLRDAATNAVSNHRTVGHNTSGTPANGFGSRYRFRLQSSTTTDQEAVQEVIIWVDATHASRKARSTFSVFDTAAREIWRGEASGAAPMIGFLGANAAVQQATASTAGIAAIRTDTLANAVADIRTILTALRAWGVTFGLTANTA